MRFINAAVRQNYSYLLRWVLLALLAGMAGSSLVHFFDRLMVSAGAGLLGIGLPLVLVPVVGALLTGLIYRLEPEAAGEGVPSYIHGLVRHGGRLPLKITLTKLSAGWLTLATFGNGGLTGPLGRVTAGLASFITGWLARRRILFTDDEVRTAAICGLAAVVGSIFHASIGGGIFAVEIIQRTKMGYRDLFPAIFASTSAVFFCKVFGWQSFYRLDAPNVFMDTSMIGYVLLLAVLTGVMGVVYTQVYKTISRVVGREKRNLFFKAIIGTLVASLLAVAVNTDLFGTSRGIMVRLFAGQIEALRGTLPAAWPLWLVMALLMMVKMLGNCVTVGTGMSAGFTGPAAITGLLLGAAAASLLRIDVTSSTYFAFLATGFAGMLAGTMNVPLAAAIMATEFFGLQYSLPAGLGAVIGFQISRQHTIYEYTMKDDETD